MNEKKRILIIIESYLPGFKNGGHGRTISNLISFYHEQFAFFVYTSNRDLGDKAPYPGIKSDVWLKQYNASILYVHPLKLWSSVANIIKEKEIDVVMTCGLFSNYALRLVIDKYFKQIMIPIIVAPMGQFGENAINSKRLIKKILLYTFKLLSLEDNTVFSLTSQYELEDLRKYLMNPKWAYNRDLPTKKTVKNLNTTKKVNNLKIIFLSRIHPQKNLKYALEVISQLKTNVTFDIYGNIEDEMYWNECQVLISNFKKNINATYCGLVEPSNVIETFSKYDVFLFPTKGENFGHVIFESLTAGCLPVISDLTPWNIIEDSQVGKVIPLSEKTKYVEYLTKLSVEDEGSFNVYRQNMVSFVHSYLDNLSNNDFHILIDKVLSSS